MEYSFIWKAFVMVLSSVLLLRIAGRKSLSQLTMAETVVMLSLGTIMVEPIVHSDVSKSVMSGGVFVLTALCLEYLQVKFKKLEDFITGKSISVIENGTLKLENLKKLRLTVNQLEMRMRNHGISSLSDIETATIEPNGLMGYEYTDDSKPLTVGEFKKLMDEYFKGNQNEPETSLFQKNKEKNLFMDIIEKDKRETGGKLH